MTRNPRAGPVEGLASLQPEQDDRGQCERERCKYGDPVEIALDHCGTHRATAKPSSEHFGHPPSPPRVKQDEEDETQRDDGVNGRNDRGCQGIAFLTNPPQRGLADWSMEPLPRIFKSKAGFFFQR